MKKLISCLIVAVLIAMLMPVYAGAEDQYQTFKNVRWQIDKKGTLTFTGEGDIPRNGPWEASKDQIKAIVFGEGITFIPNWAFDRYESLASVTFGPDITMIEEKAIVNCQKIKEMTLLVKTACFSAAAVSGSHPEKITISDDSPYHLEQGLLLSPDRKEVVYGIGNGKVVIPDGIEKIGDSAFQKSQITEISLPDTLTEIGKDAFNFCSKLKAVTLPVSLETIGYSGFALCTSVTSIEFLGSTIHLDKYNDYLFHFCSSLKSISLPTMDRIPAYCFSNCSRLEKVVINEGTEKIGAGAFAGCSKLKELYIPDSVTAIDEGFFDYSSVCTVYCHAGSYADSFATDHGLKVNHIISVSEIMLSESAVTLKKGKTADIAASIQPTDASVQHLTWFSSNGAVATVKNGKIKAVAPGECDIVCCAEDGSGVRATCHVIVE